MVRVKLIEGKEGLLVGMGVGALVYLWMYFSQNPQLYSTIAMAAANPSFVEKTFSFAFAPTFKTFIAYLGIGAVIGFLLDIGVTWWRRNF